jgi:hypothetical protein
MATLTTLFSFDGTDGDDPKGSLIVDANGDLFGTTKEGPRSDPVFGAAPVIVSRRASPTSGLLHHSVGKSYKQRDR